MWEVFKYIFIKRSITIPKVNRNIPVPIKKNPRLNHAVELRSIELKSFRYTRTDSMDSPIPNELIPLAPNI